MRTSINSSWRNTTICCTQSNSQRKVWSSTFLSSMESKVKSLSELSFLRVRSSMSKVMVCCGGDRAKVACGCSSGRQGPEAPPAHLPCPCCLVATFLPILLAPSTPNPPDPPQSTEHCDWLYGIFGHETSCTRYWTCWNGTATEQFCIGGLLYNEETHACDWPQNVAGCQKHPLCKDDANGNV